MAAGPAAPVRTDSGDEAGSCRWEAPVRRLEGGGQRSPGYVDCGGPHGAQRERQPLMTTRI